MKRRNTILSITSCFLVLLLIVGSTGAVIVKHTCYSSGLSDLHTEFFSSDSQNHDCSCDNKIPCCPAENEKTLEPVCCTFTSEKLSLTEYDNNKLISLSVTTIPVLSHLIISPEEQMDKPVYPIIFHNKHGGRDVLISNCQLII